MQNQSVYYYQMGENGQPKEFINPNTYSTDGTVRIGLSGISGDKKHMAYTVSASGSDWQEIHVRNIATNTDTKDKIMWTKFGGANWFKDGFYYSAYDAPKEGTELSAKNEYQKIYYHKLGTSQNEDKLIFEDKNNPLRYFFAQVSEDERFLIIYGSEGTSGSEVYVKDLRYEGSTPKLLFKGFDNNFEFVEKIGSKEVEKIVV